MKHNRGSERREVLFPCQVVEEAGFTLVADRVLDLSTEGMFVPLLPSRRVLTGETVIVSFAVQNLWIDTEATVARIVHGRRPGDDGIAAGIVFDPLPRPLKAALAGWLHGRSVPLPRRGPLSRLRRGEDLPQLADAKLMHFDYALPEPEPEEVDPSDILEDDGVDGLDVLRAVVGAWQSLAISS